MRSYLRKFIKMPVVQDSVEQFITAFSNIMMIDGSVFEDRKFLPGSALLSYLKDKAPYDIIPEGHEPTTIEVMMALKRIIATESLFDPGNPSVILCDSALEKALDTKYLHVSQVERYVTRHFIPEDYIITDTTTIIAHVRALSSEFPRLQVGSLVRMEVPSFWDSLSTVNPPRNSSLTDDSVFWVNPPFLEFLNSVGTLLGSSPYLSWFLIRTTFFQWIISNSRTIFDQRNTFVIAIHDTPLAHIFGRKTIARSQLQALIRKQCKSFVYYRTNPYEVVPEVQNSLDE